MLVQNESLLRVSYCFLKKSALEQEFAKLLILHGQQGTSAKLQPKRNPGLIPGFEITNRLRITWT